MAGLGWRKFQAGEVLTANNFQSYGVDQTVQRYAGTAARGSAIGTAVSEGMVSWLDDSNVIQAYDGSAWQQVYPAVLPTGTVKQVLSTAKLDATFINATSPTGISGLSRTITPSSASNKILIIAQVTTAFDANECFIRLNGGNSANFIGDASGVQTRAVANAAESTVANRVTTQTLVYLDSPATTSAVTYEVQGWCLSGGGLRINFSVNNLNTTSYTRGASSITVMEIVA